MLILLYTLLGHRAHRNDTDVVVMKMPFGGRISVLVSAWLMQWLDMGRFCHNDTKLLLDQAQAFDQTTARRHALGISDIIL